VLESIINNTISKILSFLKETQQFQLTYRFTAKPNGGFESDAEHSWSVAFAGMLFVEEIEKEFDIKLDHARMLKMALVHDLAKMETGDTKPWDIKARIGKEERGWKTMHKIVYSLPKTQQKEILDLWKECEKRETPEAKIVKSLDRLDPVLHRIVHGIGREEIMDEKDASMEAFDAQQRPHHDFSQTLSQLYKIIQEEAVRRGLIKK
jgi:putative hydrolase of HD superfamily